MNFKFFNRIAEVIIGKSGQPGFKITDLRITFDLVKTSTSESNSGKITIYNLSKTTQNKIKADSDLLLQLLVGYSEGSKIETIFVGDILDVNHDNISPNFSTIIEVGDGAKAIKRKKWSCSFAKGATLRQVIEAASKEFGLPEKTRLSLVNIPNVTFNTGYAFEGYIANLLDELCKDNALEWSVQNNELKIYPKKSTDKSTIVKTVLIGSPRHIIKKSKQNSLLESETFNGWEFDTLLLPQAEPGGSILLSSRDVFPEISLKVKEVKHAGDTHGDDWKTTIKGEAI